MTRKSLKEAGNYNNLNQGERVMLQNMKDPNIRNAIANVVSQFRAKGKTMDPITAAQQIMQVPHFKSDQQAMGMLQQFVNSNQNLTGLTQAKKPTQPDPFGLKNPPKGVPVPPQLQGQQQQIAKSGAAPMTPGPTAGDQFNALRNSKTTNNDIEFGRAKAAAHGETPDADPSDPFEAAKLRRMGMAQKQAATPRGTMPAKGANPPPGIPSVNPLARTMMPKRRPTNEGFGTGMSSAIQNVMNTVTKLKPEELMAIANLVNSLMKQKGTRSTMGTTTMEHKKLVTEVLKFKIQEQINARNTAAKLLSEGPMANMWDKIKGAGSAIGQSMGFGGQAGQQAQAVGVDENSKRASQELTKTLSKVNQFRSKFNGSTLKNAEAMNGYHDLVLNAVQMYQQYQHMLGPFGQQLVRQIHDAVGNLVYDLNSEKEHIDAFLKQLKQAGMANINPKSVGGSAMIKGPDVSNLDTTALGKEAQKRSQASRVQENPGAGARARSAMGPSGNTMQHNMALNKHAAGDKQGSMNDLQKLYAKQAGDKKKKKPAKKSGKKK